MMLPLTFLLANTAQAADVTGVTSLPIEYMGNQYAPPLVVFVVDAHEEMRETCNWQDSRTDCVPAVGNAIRNIIAHHDWARFAVIMTSTDGSNEYKLTDVRQGSYFGINRADSNFDMSVWGEFGEDIMTSSFIGRFPPTPSGDCWTGSPPGNSCGRNLGETLYDHASTQKRGAAATDLAAATQPGDEMPGTWFNNQTTHYVYIVSGVPHADTGGIAPLGGSPDNLVCDYDEVLDRWEFHRCPDPMMCPAVVADDDCTFEDVVTTVYGADMRSNSYSDGTQAGFVHIVYLEQDTSIPAVWSGGADDDPNISNHQDLAHELFDDAWNNQGQVPSYIRIDGAASNHIEPALNNVMWNIRGITFGRTLANDTDDGAFGVGIDTVGDIAVTAWGEPVGSDSFFASTGPRTQGEMEIWQLDTDPTSTTYGLPTGEIANSDVQTRISTRTPTTPPLNGNYTSKSRNLYTWLSDLALMDPPGGSGKWVTDRRMPFDDSLASELTLSDGGNAIRETLLPGFAPLTPDTGLGCSHGSRFNLSNSTCYINDGDIDALIDFAHGDTSRPYHWWISGETVFLEPEVGDYGTNVPLLDWGGALPTIASYTNTSTFTLLESYKTYLDMLGDLGYPRIALIPSQSGMIHAFALDDPSSVFASGSIGDELWAWIPESVLVHEDTTAELRHSWENRFVDTITYGRQIVWNGTPVVSDVWIDMDGDEAKDCDSSGDVTDPNDCEWRKVAVFNQKDGGTATLILDITNPYEPRYLDEWWPRIAEADSDAIETTYSIANATRPVISIARDNDGGEDLDRPIAFIGSGLPLRHRNQNVTSPSDVHYQDYVEPDILEFPIFWNLTTQLSSFPREGENVNNWNDAIEPATLGNTHDDDGDAVLTDDLDTDFEFAGISTPLAMLDADADGDPDVAYFAVAKTFVETEDGAALTHLDTPGSSYLYKACRTDPSNWTFKPLYDMGARPMAVEHAPTLSWFSDGRLGVFWGTGSANDPLPYAPENAFLDIMSSTPQSAAMFFGIDDDPADCAGDTFSVGEYETTAQSACSSGVFTFTAGERLVGDPVVYAGYLLFTTYNPKGPDWDGDPWTMLGETAPQGYVRALSYTDCADDLDMGDGTADGLLAIDGFPSNIAITDYGTVLVAGSQAPNSFAASFRMDGGLFESVKILNWMEVF